MKVKAKILACYPEQMRCEVRFYTDVLPPELLSNHFQQDGGITRKQDGDVHVCKTDVSIDIPLQIPQDDGTTLPITKQSLSAYVLRFAPTAALEREERFALSKAAPDLELAAAQQALAAMAGSVAEKNG